MIKKQLKQKQKEEEKKQREEAERLVEFAHGLIDHIVENGFVEVWQFKAIHSLLAEKMKTAIDTSKIADLVKKEK